MTITVPTTLEDNPLFVIVNGVQYALGPGETITIPDEIGNEMYRMIAAGEVDAPAVDVPFENAKVNAEIDILKSRMTAAETAIAVKELPAFPDPYGTGITYYNLQYRLVGDTPTLVWQAYVEESVSQPTET